MRFNVSIVSPRLCGNHLESLLPFSPGEKKKSIVISWFSCRVLEEISVMSQTVLTFAKMPCAIFNKASQYELVAFHIQSF